MKYCLITGSCGGLGREFSRQLAEQKKNLILVGTDAKRLNELKLQLKNDFADISIETAVCDQSKKEARNLFFKQIENFEIESAILNAGYIDEGALSTKTDEQIEGVIRTNCEGTILIAKHLFEQTKQQNGSLHLLVTSSLSAFYPMPQMAIYAASKAMLLNFFLAVREELRKDDIKISVLCPGGIYTTPAMKDAIKAQGLGGKLSSHTPEKVAKIGLKALKKGKAIAIPGSFNRFLKFAGTSAPRTFTAKQIGKRWQKSRKKRTTF